MKRWIHANSISDQIAKIQKSKQALSDYDKEKVDYVKECQNRITKAISDYYTEKKDEYDYNLGAELSEIKRDYMLGAIEDDLMTEEEFEDIMALMDVVDLELAAPYA